MGKQFITYNLLWNDETTNSLAQPQNLYYFGIDEHTNSYKRVL